MHVASHERRRFIADGAIAESGALGAAGDNADVQGHGFRVTQKTVSPQRHRVTEKNRAGTKSEVAKAGC